MKDKTDLLLEAVEHPERFSDEDLASLFADPEIRDLYGMMCKGADAMADIPTTDIDREWEVFAGRHMQGRPRFLRLPLSRQAAAILIGVAASLAVAATIGISHSAGRPEAAPAAEPPREADLAAPAARTPQDTMPTPASPMPETVTFKDESLEHIISAIAARHGAAVRFKSDAAHHLRLYFKWEQALPLAETVNQLNNFGQINIVLDRDTLTVD